MAKSGLSLKALLQLETKQFQQGLNKVKRQLSNFGNIVKSAFALGSVTAFGKQMVNLSKDFEDSMARVKSITNASTSEFQKMQKEALKMGATTRYTASEAANALENLTRNGMTASQATKALSGVMQLAQANAIGLAEAADIVTNTLNMFGLSVKETARVNDVLSSTASNAATNITDLYEALVNAAPAAKVLGFDVEEVSAAIGALAQKGVKGADAGTQLRMSLTKMADPKIIAKMQAMGVAIDEESMKSDGLLKTIGKLKDAQLGLTDLVEIFSQRGAVGMQQLISAYDEFDHMLQVTRNSAGTTARMFEQGVGSTRKELDTLKSMYEGLLLSIGSKTSGVVNRTIKLLQNLINNFKSVGGTMMNVASVVVPLLLRNIMKLGKGAATTFAAMKTGVLGLKAAMGGWVTIIASVVTWIGTALYGAWAKVNQPIKDAKKNMKEVETSASKLSKEAKKLVDELGPDSDGSTLAGVIKRLCELYPDFSNEIQNAYTLAGKTKNWETLRNILQDIVELQEQASIKEAQGEIYNAQVKKLGAEMYGIDDSGRRHGVTMQALPNGSMRPTYNPEVNTIRKALEDAGYETEQIKVAFEEIARIATDAKKTEGQKYAEIGRYLNDVFGIEGLGREVYRPFLEMAKKSMEGSYSNASGTSTRMAQGDSTVNKLLFDKFQSDSLLIKQALDAKEITDKEYQQRMFSLVSDLEARVDRTALSTDQKDMLNSLSGMYQAPKTSGTGGSGSGGDEDKKSPYNQVKNALTGFTESSEQLNSQLKAGSITQEEYKKQMADLVEKTYLAITAFGNFNELLAKMPQSMQDTAAGIAQSFTDNLTSVAQKKIDEQTKKLGGYVATEGTRDSRYDYMHDGAKQPGQTFSPLQKHALEQQVNISLDYSDALAKMIADLKKAIDDGEFDLVKEDALKKLKDLEGEFGKAKNEAESFQHVLNFAEAQEQLAELQVQLRETAVNTVGELARGIETIGNSLFDIMELFDEDLKDSELYKSFETFMTVINSMVSVLQTVQGVIEAVGAAKKLLAQISKTTAAQEVAADMAVAGAEGTKAAASAGAAAAGAGSAVSSIPIVGPILAVAAIGTVVAAIIAAMSKFANGGIVGGNSTTGDNNVVRANSGEMILTKGQQATLFNAISKGNLGGGGNVQFKIRGSDLIGVINNEQSRIKG